MDPNKQLGEPVDNSRPNPEPAQSQTPQPSQSQDTFTPANENVNPVSFHPNAVNSEQSSGSAQTPSQPPSNPLGPQPIVGNFQPDNPPQPKNTKKKKWYIAGAAALALLLAISGFVFGYYLPNQPENVYRTGLDRSGDALHGMVLEATETEKLEQIKKSEFNGSLGITSDFGNIDGSFNAKLDPTKSDSKLDVTFKPKDGPEQSYGLKLLTELQDGKRFPDSYFQLTGIRALQLDAFAPGISDYDGKWIAVSADYLESLGEGYLPPEEKNNKENVSAEEVAELISGVSEVNSEYLFSSDPEKAVLENREYLGKEKTAEGIDSFHYLVGINKSNAAAYCKALSDRVLSSRAAQKFFDADDEEINKQKKSAGKDCDDSAKDIEGSDTFEMWIDAKYKLIHKFRIYDEQDKKDQYTDIGQIYTGGDNLAFFALYHDDKDNFNAKFTLDVNLEENNSKAALTASQEGDSAFNGQGSIAAKPYDGEINTQRPAGTIPISEILAKFGFDPTSQSGISSAGGGSIQLKANDSEIKSDMQAIASQVEIYFADNAVYPTLSQLNSKAFRTEKLTGLSQEALSPPGSAKTSLGSSSSASQYAYAPSSCDPRGCQKFILSGLLSTGEIHKLVGSNN